MATYTVESAGEYVGGRVDDLSATLWGTGYQFLLVGTWTGNNSLLKLYDLGEGAVFHEEQSLDPTIGGNDVALAAPVADRALFGFKKLPGGKTSYLTWRAGTLAVDDSTEAAYQDHDLELAAFHEPAHPLFHGGELAAQRAMALEAARPSTTTHRPGDTPGPQHGSGTVKIVGKIGATMSQKAIHAVAASITGLHKMRLAIWHFEGGGQLRTQLGSYPEDVSEPATQVKIVTTAEYLIDGMLKAGDILTAVRHNNQLKLIRWRYDRRDSPDSLVRIGEVTLAEQVEECGLTTIRTGEGVVAVTVVRLTTGGVKVIGWKLSSDGSLSRWLESPVEAGSSISCAHVRNSDFVSAMKLQKGGQLRLIYWRFPFNGSPSGVIVRLADQNGDAVDWVKCLHQPGQSQTFPGHTITLSRLSNDKLKLRRWSIVEN